MTGEEKCNRCEQFGPNGLTDYPCKRIPSRNCPWFIKISDKKYKKILADRVKRIKENNRDIMYNKFKLSRCKRFMIRKEMN